MKKCAAFLLILILLLTGCAGNQPNETTAATEDTLPSVPVSDPDAFRFTRENFPVLDGSTSLLPLGQGIASVLLGESREDAADLINFNRTTESFRFLRKGMCDVVIAAEPKQTVFSEMTEEGFAWEIETIAREALIFIVNENNPVDSLTREQVRDIYAGKITNWKEVGGADAPIEAFQRNATAGSQVMMEKLVMDGTPMMEAPEAYVPGSMGGLIEAVKSYDNSANAIGYTVFYYASDMQMARGLKILKIDGVLPDTATLQSEEYPFLNGYYCCISAKEPTDSPARRLYNWLVSESGQQLLRLEGYVSVFGEGEAAASGKDVAMDYTAYVPYGGVGAKYTDLPGGTGEQFVVSDSYGAILPYNGSLLYSSPEMEEFDYQRGELLGFFAIDGTRITAPVFSSIVRCTFGDWYGQDFVWVMERTYGPEKTLYAAASPDGSRVTDLIYTQIEALGDELICWTDDSFVILDKDFRQTADASDFRINGMDLVPYRYDNGMYFCVDYSGDYEWYVLNDQKQLLSGPWVYADVDDYGNLKLQSESGMTVLDSEGNQLSFDGYTEVENCFVTAEHYFAVELPDGRSFVTDLRGNLFDWDYRYVYSSGNDVLCVVREDTVTYYDAQGKMLFGGPVDSRWDYMGVGALFSCQEGDSFILRDFAGGKELRLDSNAFAYGWNSDREELSNYIYLNRFDGDVSHCSLLNPNLDTVLECSGNLSWILDPISGQVFVLTTGSYGFSGESRVYTPDCSTEVFRVSASVDCMGGLFMATNEWAFTAYDTDGNVVFCWPFYGFASGD